MSAPVLEVQSLNVSFQVGGGAVHAVRDLSLTVAQGEVIGLVGESGSGKSVTMMSVVRLLDPQTPDIRAGKMNVDGCSLLDLGRRELEAIRGPVVSYIFQDPLTALNPLLTVGRQITEGMRRHRRPVAGRGEETGARPAAAGRHSRARNADRPASRIRCRAECASG